LKLEKEVKALRKKCGGAEKGADAHNAQVVELKSQASE
jgi:hypothetical protein